MPPRGRRKRGRKVRRFFNRRQYRRLFAKWRRAVLHRFSSRPVGRRYRGALRLDRRTAFARNALVTAAPYAVPVRLRTTSGARTLRWLRGRLGYRRGNKGQRQLRVLTSPAVALGALRTSRRLGGVTAPLGARNSALLARMTAVLETRRQTMGGTGAAAPLLGSRRAALSFILRARHQLEQKTCRQQLKLRLPRTAVKRRGLRQGGRTLFAQGAKKVLTT